MHIWPRRTEVALCLQRVRTKHAIPYRKAAERPADPVICPRFLWTDVPRCRHHVLSRLAPSSRVLFVSPPPTQIRDVAGKLRQDGLKQDGLTQVSPGNFQFCPTGVAAV